MLGEVAALRGLYQVNEQLVIRAFDRLTEEEAWFRSGQEANPMIWVLGHLVVGRHGVCQYLGAPLEHAFGERFSRGAKLGPRQDCPPLQELLTAWSRVSAHLNGALERVTEPRWNRAVERDFPGVERTVAGAVRFLHFHESYHVGQLAYIRRTLGETRLVG